MVLFGFLIVFSFLIHITFFGSIQAFTVRNLSSFFSVLFCEQNGAHLPFLVVICSLKELFLEDLSLYFFYSQMHTPTEA